MPQDGLGALVVLGSDMLTLSCFQRCKVHTDTAITCPSPAASNITVGSKPAPVDFYLNGRLYTDDRSALDEEMYPEEALHISKFSLEYYADPQFSTAKKEKWIKHHPGEPLTLVIHVRGWLLQLCYSLGAAIFTLGSSSVLSTSTVAVHRHRRDKGMDGN